MLANQDQNQSPRQMGVAGEDDSKKKPTAGSIWAQAKAILAAKAEKSAARKAERDSRPVPNYICYPAAFPHFDPTTGRGAPSPLPTCHVCGGRLHPMENHRCDGFTPKYVEKDQDWQDRQEQRREDIEESRPWTYDYDGEPIVMCDVCGERMYDPEDAHAHFEDHGGKPEDTRHARDGEPDGDLDGYEDESEEDYCEGDDDGYDCD